MNAVRLALGGALWLGLGGVGGAEKGTKANGVEEKLIGRWEVVKGEGLGPGSVTEFHKGGKLTVLAKRKDEERKIQATWKVKGKAFQITFKDKDEERTRTIKVTKISDKELHTEA